MFDQIIKIEINLSFEEQWEDLDSQMVWEWCIINEIITEGNWK